MTEVTYASGWPIICLFMAALPWVVRFLIDGVPRVSLAQIGLMVTAIAGGLAAPRAEFNLTFVVVLVYGGSWLVTTMGRKD